ncbi:MAG: hypothetical protein HRT67_05470 [Flavobacteriaceae bacterium]|nr:hypothetical protein [Flavobacteriaceae bacterium]
MGLDIIIFISTILFGILLYWRESNTNKLYRIFNKICNAKELQMKADDKKGFVFQQQFMPRLVYITILILFTSVIIQFITPFKLFVSYDGISIVASCIVGTLIGTYVAHLVLKSGEIIEESSDDLSYILSDTIRNGKSVYEDMTTKEEVLLTDSKPKTFKTSEKSARERLKDKGLLK